MRCRWCAGIGGKLPLHNSATCWARRRPRSSRTHLEVAGALGRSRAVGACLASHPCTDTFTDFRIEEKTMQAIQLTAYGDPSKFLKSAELPEPKQPGHDEVLIEVDFSPVNPNDLMLAQGIYSVDPELPSVIGNEGVGHVIAVGSRVTSVQIGDRVLVPLHVFAWAERVVAPAQDLIKLSRDTDIQQLSMLRINPPTAALLLSEYVALKPGEWIVQNAANSGVGRAVIAFARERGIRTVNLVRRPELIDELTAVGGDVVLLDSPDAPNLIQKKTENSRIRLALDGVSGPATALLAAIVSSDSTIVSYSAMSGAPISISPLDVIFK